MTEKELKALPVGAVLQLGNGETLLWNGFKARFESQPVPTVVRPQAGGALSIYEAKYLQGVPITPQRLRDWLKAEKGSDPGQYWIGRIRIEEYNAGDAWLVGLCSYTNMGGMVDVAIIDYVHQLQQYLALPRDASLAVNGIIEDWEINLEPTKSKPQPLDVDSTFLNELKGDADG